jgi:hypothetical protein
LTPKPDQPQHHRLCYRPAVFFRHLPVIALSFPKGKIRLTFKNTVLFISTFLNFAQCQIS